MLKIRCSKKIEPVRKAFKAVVTMIYDQKTGNFQTNKTAKVGESVQDEYEKPIKDGSYKVGNLIIMVKNGTISEIL